MDLKTGDLVRVRPIENPMVGGLFAMPGFRGTLVRIYTDHRGREIADVREDGSHGLCTVLADRLRGKRGKKLGAIAYPDDYKGPKQRRAPTPRDPSDPHPPRAPRADGKACTCGCGGTTGGGNFLPGHDARLVSMVLRGEAKPAVLADFPKLLAKYQAKAKGKGKK